MTVSIIVPVYNTSKYLEKCVNSLCRQTHKDLEIIIINDGSEDDSLVVMNELAKKDSRIIVVNKEHSGLSATKNVGLDRATGDFVSFIDSDDWVSLDMYEVLLQQSIAHSADAVYCEWMTEYEDGSSSAKGHNGKKRLIFEGKGILEQHFQNRLHFRSSSSIVKREIIGDLRFDTNFQPGEEQLFGFFILCKSNCIVYIDMPFYHRYVRQGSITNSGFKRADIKKAACTDRMVKYVEANRPELCMKAYAYSFTFYMMVLNKMVYYKCIREYADIFKDIMDRLYELKQAMRNIRKVLPLQVYFAYTVFNINKQVYYGIVRVYYKSVKRQYS